MSAGRPKFGKRQKPLRQTFRSSENVRNTSGRLSEVRKTLENAPAEEELKNIPGVTKVKKLDEHTFRIQFEREGEEEAKRVAEICVNRGWRLSEIQMEKVSMDEIFAQLSGKRVVEKF